MDLDNINQIPNGVFGELVNFVYHPEITDEQKRKMYSALEKEELIEMLIEANKHLDSLAHPVSYYCWRAY